MKHIVITILIIVPLSLYIYTQNNTLESKLYDLKKCCDKGLISVSDYNIHKSRLLMAFSKKVSLNTNNSFSGVTDYFNNFAPVKKVDNKREQEKKLMDKCVQSMKKIEGAIEMYQMDNNTGKNFDFSELLGKNGILRKEGYLRRFPVCPKGGRYFFDPKCNASCVDVKCTVHGSVPEPHFKWNK